VNRISRERAPTRAELKGLLDKIIAWLMKMLTRLGYLVEEQGVSYIADIDADNPWRHCKRPRAPIASRWGRAPDRRC
jgi:hypothetical protein